MNTPYAASWKSIPVLHLILASLALMGCEKRDKQPRPPSPAQGEAANTPPPGSLELVFAYGSEKKNWVTEATNAFNASAQKLPSGKPIFVTAKPMGSGESKDDILQGRLQAHLWSPASSVFVTLGNAESLTKGSPLVGQTEELVLSPVVIAMWKPMAEALGWPNKPIGWKEILDLARNTQGWGAYGRPELGAFKFGHTHPEYSNSGLISILAEVYAGAGKVRGLNSEDLAKPEVTRFMQNIESAVVHYGSSTGFFGKALYENGPQYLSAAVVYENMVVESYAKNASVPLVAIYPKEGTFWSDHPVGVVQRPWVTEEHKAAAKIYTEYLLAPEQQAKALSYGFRPAKGSVGAPIDQAHGVAADQPKTILEMPSAAVIQQVVELWRKNKKPADIVLVFDKSGSMQEENRMANAQAGARELLNMLDDRDSLALVPFSNDINLIPGGAMASNRAAMTSRIDGLIPDGSTRLYRAIETAYKHLATQADPSRIAAIVVLTDGEDNDKTYSLDQLLGTIRQDAEKHSVRIFTIGYGKDAKMDVLKRISRETKAQAYEGKPQNIREVFKDIATFF